jgi:GMP synthase (glutamine-hydrolysing)
VAGESDLSRYASTPCAIVRRLSEQSGFHQLIWQFPIVLLPCGVPGKPDSIVLRPIDSVDGMTP